MALGITTILTIMFLLGSLNGNLPKVSYPKALDWYLLVSFSFVFMSLVECMIVFILNLRAAEDKKRIKCKVCLKMLWTVFAVTYSTSRVHSNVSRAKYGWGILALCAFLIDQFGSTFRLFASTLSTQKYKV